MTRRTVRLLMVAAALVAAVACGKKAPVTYPAAPAPGPNAFPGAGAASGTSLGTERPPDPPPIPGGGPVRSTPLSAAETERFNENSPLVAVLFAYDSDEIDETGKKVLTSNAEILRTNRTWVVTVEGHSDERGTAEYNLALGDRRAQSAKNFLVSLGIAAERLRTVSYGEEFPFDAGHDEASWTKNRRAHFMVTSK